MNRILLTMTALGALAAAAPAAAQADTSASATARIQNRITQLEARIEAGVDAGTISRAEERTLMRQLRRIERLELQFSRDGLTDVERNDLQSRIRALRHEIRTADGRMGRDDRYGDWDDDDDRYADRIDSNNDGWDDRDYDRDGRWDDDVGDGRFATRIDRNNDGWDDRDYDRDGRWDDDVRSDGRYATRIDRNRDGWDDRDYDRDGRWDEDEVYGVGGPYEEVECVGRGGIAGIFDRVLGSDECPGLRVGQRATGNLGAVPYEHRRRFPDGNGVYYRSDGRSIYRIDARTHTVLRVYSIDN
jgi:hypothetical protein